MDEVAAVSVAAMALLGKGMAPLGLVGPIGLHVYPQLFWSVGELALAPVRAETFLGEVSAE